MKALTLALMLLPLAGCTSGHVGNDCDQAASWHKDQGLYEANATRSAWHHQKAQEYLDAAHSWYEPTCKDWRAYREGPWASAPEASPKEKPR